MVIGVNNKIDTMFLIGENNLLLNNKIVTVLLSFSHFRHELETRSKDHTIRPFNPKRFMQLTDAKQYECWWMTKVKS